MRCMSVYVLFMIVKVNLQFASLSRIRESGRLPRSVAAPRYSELFQRARESKYAFTHIYIYTIRYCTHHYG